MPETIAPPVLGPDPAPPPPPLLTLPSVEVGEQEAQAIIAECLKFKKSVKQHAREKKRAMQRNYAYLNSKFYGDDLLPLPAAHGQDRDAQSNRPQIFIPLTRQQAKLLYSQVKLSLFPNNEDFFRIKAKNNNPIGPVLLDPMSGMPYQKGAAEYEDELTEGVAYIFRQSMLTEKLGKYLLDCIWAGFGACWPTFRIPMLHEWTVDPTSQQYVPIQTQGEPVLDLDVWSPIEFYPDPYGKDPDNSKWGYFTQKKRQEIIDCPYTLQSALEPLRQAGSTSPNRSIQNDGLNLDEFNEIQQQFLDNEEYCRWDVFYFPFLRTSTGTEYRNMWIALAEERILCEFRPNFMPKGVNPVVFSTWMDDKDSPYGTGPVEDMANIQKTVNIIYNYMIETAARIGNRFAVSEQVDLTNFFGLSGGVMVTPNPGQDVIPLTGNFEELVVLQNLLGTLKAEAQLVAGSQNPFQGSSNIDFKKTATEIQVLQENAISITREVIEHLVASLERILERLVLLISEVYTEPMTVRVEDPMTGSQYLNVDFSLLKSGNYTIELTSVNASQSKQAQVETLTRFFEVLAGNPQAVLLGEPVLQKIAELQGMRDFPDLMEKIKQSIAIQQQQMMQQQAMMAAAAPPPETEDNSPEEMAA